MFGIGLIILFPLAIVLTVISYFVGIGIATVIGFFCGPFVIIGETYWLQGCLGCVLCPFLLIGGAVIGFFGSICYGLYIGY